MRAALDRFRCVDWRLRLYTLLVPVFWLLALGPGDGGAAGVAVSWDGALINCLLLIPLWRRSMWAVTLLGVFAMWTTMVVGSIGLPPWGPAFGALALVAGAQFLLLFTYDLGYRLGAEDAERRGARTPARPRRPGRT